MNFMESFSYSQTVRWCYNIEFGNVFGGPYICIITSYVSTRLTVDNIYMQYYFENEGLIRGKLRFKHCGGYCSMGVFL